MTYGMDWNVFPVSMNLAECVIAEQAQLNSITQSKEKLILILQISSGQSKWIAKSINYNIQPLYSSNLKSQISFQLQTVAASLQSVHNHLKTEKAALADAHSRLFDQWMLQLRFVPAQSL